MITREVLDMYLKARFKIFPVYGVDDEGRCLCRNVNCQSPGKHPMTARGHKDASNDPETVYRWWESFPNANIGIATGEASDFFVVDVDVKSGGFETLKALENKHGKFSVTPTVKTGGGGRHFYFELPQNLTVKNSAGKVGPGIDIRGDGGYIVVPPSNHVSGDQYEWWIPLSVPMAEAPQWLFDLMTGRALVSSQTTGTNGALLQQSYALVPGRRNSTLMSIAGNLRRNGLGPDEIFATLKAVNDNSLEPLHDNEVAGIAKGVLRYEPTLLNDLTETGVSQLLTGQFAGTVIYCENLGWLTFTPNGVWERDGEGLAVQELAKELVAKIKYEGVAACKGAPNDE